jgi:hypothetical protein
MSEEPIDPLPPALASLFAREANAYPEDPATKARVLQRVVRAAAFSLPPVGAGAGAGAGALFGAARVAAFVAVAFVSGGVVGGVAVWGLLRDGSTSRVTAAAPVGAASSLASGDQGARTAGSFTAGNDGPGVAPLSIPVGELPSSRAPARADASSTSAMPSGSTTDRAGSLAREREVIDVARAALVNGHYDEVLAAVHKHEAQWPHGALEEEREALAIQALAGAGRGAAAQERAARFHRHFPASMLSDVVTAAVAPAGAPGASAPKSPQ